jgi:spermidine/putrescine transport system substrate-binding protein
MAGPDTTTDRRTFLNAAATLGVVGATGVAGCTGGDDGDGTDDGDGGDGGSASSDGGGGDGTDGGEGGGGLESELHVLQRPDAWPNRFVRRFQDEYDVDVSVTAVDSTAEMLAELESTEPGAYDLLFPRDRAVAGLVDRGAIRPLDLDRLSNWGNLSERFQRAPYDPGSERHSAPYLWGTTGIGWNIKMIGDVDVSSWSAMWNDEWAGRITMLDDVRETVGAALKSLGNSLNSTDADELDRARELLLRQHPKIQAYDSTDLPTALVYEDASPVHVRSDDFMTAFEKAEEREEESPLRYVVPKEGSSLWVTTATIAADAANPNAAHAFVDHFLDAENAAEVSSYTSIATPVGAAEEHVDDEILSDGRIYPDDSTMETLEFVEPLGDARPLYEDVWDVVRGA